MKKFEVGKKYFAVSVCDSECRWEFVIEKRTAKSLWINGERFKIHAHYDGVTEMIYPLGRYSMAPILNAERMVV
jgi:hypothetical protein